ncbi:MAG: hypothetical protein Q8J62_07880 [Candidatus Cloacimonadaceae bacterium]|nr:hypothetical protein [Candidatus Cloacimonadaceae bacterium]
MNQSTPNPAKVELNFKPIRMKLHFAIILFVLLSAFVLYFFMPVISIRFVGWAVALAFCMLPFLSVKRIGKIVRIAYMFLALFIVLAPIVSSGVFRARSYRNLIGEVKSTDFTELISPIKLDQIPVVDRSFAASLAEKKLGDDFALGSRVTLGWPTRQMVKGELYWVIPLLHSGFFKWMTNISEGTPGYIMISATNPQKIDFVREINGKPILIKYQANSYFNQNLHRHLYLNGYVTRGVGDYTFEIDDDGEPYWTATVYDHKIGVLGSEAVALAVVHAGTGKISHYPMIKTAEGWSDEKIPAWIDRVQPAEFVLLQLDWWGKYVRGFWNTVFGKRDMLMVTEGYNIIYGNDERSYFYTGMSSVGNDEGTVGFMLTDTRSKRTHLYRMSGATEYAAQMSAQGKVQNFKYSATFPILVNMNGIATYFMTLKDSAGLVKQFAFVSVKDFSIVGVGESIKAARDNYQMTLASSRIGTIPEGTAQKITFTGTIARVGVDIKEARAYYYISISEKPGKIFIATTNLSSYLPIAKAGDTISIEYLETEDLETNLTALKITNLE